VRAAAALAIAGAACFLSGCPGYTPQPADCRCDCQCIYRPPVECEKKPAQSGVLIIPGDLHSQGIFYDDLMPHLVPQFITLESHQAYQGWQVEKKP